MGRTEVNELQPTVWRTCRALANRRRLRLLREVIRQPDQTVSALARRSGVSLPLASMCLRALNARGLLQTRRSGREVFYRPEADRSVPGAASLLSAMEDVFAASRDPVRDIFRLATAFTHPRRVDIVRTLQNGVLPEREIRIRTGISRDALSRHLRKLETRGVLAEAKRGWRCAEPQGRLAAVLLLLARGR